MKRAILFSTAVAVLFCLSGLPLMAQGRGAGGMGGGGGMGQPGGAGMGQGPMDTGPMGHRMPGMDNAGMNRGRNGGSSMHTQKTPSQMLQENTKLSGKLQPLLPKGANVQQAASGFKNLGQFVAAVHVSHNLNIPFDEIKGKMTTGDSLGKAVQELNPKLSHKQIKSEVKKGKHQAKEDIKASRHS